MAELCDFVSDDGTVSRDQAVAAVQAYNEGRLPRADSVTIVVAYNDDSSVDQCVTSGDNSTASVAIDNITPSPNEITGQYTVSNTITSGDGEILSPVVVVTVNGRQVNTQEFVLRPGELINADLSISDPPSGEVEVCVDVR